jgi:DNA-binding LytR/AlgR family response regulator
MLNIGICDDELPVLEKLRTLVTDYGRERHRPFCVKLYRSENEIIDAIAVGQNFDILFLDIYFGDSDGIALAHRIRKMNRQCAIIFATNSRERAIEGYGVRAVQYILKPLSGENVAQALDQALESVSDRNGEFVRIQNRQGLWRIPVSDIIYAESDARVISIHTARQGSVSYYDRLDNFEKLCGDRRFLRSHKSFLVNLDYVHAIVNNRLELETGEEIPISIGIHEAKEAFASHIAGTL